LEAWSQTSDVEQYNCPQCKKSTRVTNTVRFESFPDILMVHMKRFVFSEWVPKKLTIDVDVDKEINLANFQGKGLQGNEKPFASAAPAAPVVNQGMVEQLVQMGFTQNASERAVMAVDNAGVDPAMNWLLAHLEDANINDPLPKPKAAANAEVDTSDPDTVANLSSMGFSAERVKFALKQTNNNADRALDWLFSHTDESLPSKKENKDAEVLVDTSPPKYRLVGAITHLGASTGTGHYVAHLLKEGKWVLYNDSKVSVASKDKLSQAYLYFFRKA